MKIYLGNLDPQDLTINWMQEIREQTYSIQSDPQGPGLSSKAILVHMPKMQASGGKQVFKKEGCIQLEGTAGHPSVAVGRAAPGPAQCLRLIRGKWHKLHRIHSSGLGLY